MSDPEDADPWPDEASGPDRIDRLYAHLSIIDAKAANLLTFNGIALATLAILLSRVPETRMQLLLSAVFLLQLTSCAFSLMCTRLRWDEEPVDTLEALKKRRTLFYRAGWGLAAAALLALLTTTLAYLGCLAAELLGRPGLCRLPLQ